MMEAFKTTPTDNPDVLEVHSVKGNYYINMKSINSLSEQFFNLLLDFDEEEALKWRNHAWNTALDKIKQIPAKDIDDTTLTPNPYKV